MLLLTLLFMALGLSAHAQAPASASRNNTVVSSASASPRVTSSSRITSSDSSAFAVATSTSNATADTTQITMPFMNTVTSAMAGSVVAADACETTYAFRCTDIAGCNGLSVSVTATIGPSNVEMALTTTTAGIVIVGWQSCSFSGSNHAVCAYSDTINNAMTTTRTAGVSTITGASSVWVGTVSITAGASKIAAVTGTCSQTPSPGTAQGGSQVSSQTSRAAAPAATAAVGLVKVLVAPVAAVAMAAAGGMF
ncbi:hypothetical protein BAUCODRAFT_152830 [Baudoinia panamericana UAMH 10762]|uniref:Uncharacterized protein n=1 Tax=Baudoinia panamericana (strain UAMH 10762) TaxID=717646 RepID=M2MHU3_BAUPA|nr:uncharacterized protein BAUCODRAFT_152830 [Baudoinia panamericana UAMH 10762]EMC90828.1 hypothetical protein BAUCODRAFT_152830 [Baudoinia panamericana UAMH 10762]